MMSDVRKALLISLLLCVVCRGERLTVDLDFDWLFHRGDASGAHAPDFADDAWRRLDLPHDWGIEGDYDRNSADGGAGAYLPGGVGWYRRVIDVPEQWLDKHVRIEFDAAQRNSEVWINGHHLGSRPYGYISFAYDLSPHLSVGRNVIAVRLDNPLPAARWYTGSGIYAPVRLVVCDKTRIPQWGTFVSADAQGNVQVATEIVNEEPAADLLLISQVFLRDEVVMMAKAKVDGATVRESLRVAKPELWSPDAPSRYVLKQQLFRGGRVIDEVYTPFGFRTVRFDANTGFWLNGQNIKLKGVGIHYDASPLGVAIPEEILERRLRRLKEMGCNAIRTGHTPFPPKFYDLCDRLGLMVMDEIFDGWRQKVAHDYGATAFEKWWNRDLTDWVRRDRNHPSVIIWSIGNETGHDDRYRMTGIIRQLDPTRTTTGGQCLEGVGVAGFNGPGEVPGVLEKFHREHPETPIVLTEATHAYQTRGFYRVVTNHREKDAARITEFEPYRTKEIFDDGDEQFRSSYDNAPVRITSRQCWKRTRDTPWISGEFRWAGYDYLGEAHWGGRLWPARHWHPGIHDTCGLPKDTSFFYQSQWTTQPMVHLLPHWSHPALPRGTVIPVAAYSNCDEVELFLNDRSLGRNKPRAELLDFVWPVPYEPGEMKAVAYRGGTIAATTRVRTAGAPRQIQLTPDDNVELKADRRDVKFVTFNIADESGELVPWAMDRAEFKTEGPVRLLGCENGNPIDVTPNRASYRDAFYGRGRAFFQATEVEGPIELAAAAILGDRGMRCSKQVAMAVTRVPLRGQLSGVQLAIHYTLDGSEPSSSSLRYNKPIDLTAPTRVRMLVLRDGQPWMRSEAMFAPAATTTTAPAVAQADGFNAHPRDPQVVGDWAEGDRIFTLAPDGRVLRRRAGDARSAPVGRWWYDFPDDVFEDAQQAGTGKIRWESSGDLTSLRLQDRDGKVLLLRGQRSRQWKR